MGLFDRMKVRKDATRRQKAREIKQEIANHLTFNPLCSDYENVFAQVQPLINDMKMVRPFGVGKNGGRLPMQRTPELALLDSPNDEMGWGEFAGAMFATWLTEDELNIHVHHRNRTVLGYTIIPPHSKVYLSNGDYYFQVYTEDGYTQISKDDVMTLRFSRSPKDLQRGVSPATAVRAWAQAEDVLAQYERSYIENGAIPASITFIRASSQDKYNQVRKELENNLTGARNHGKTIYVWRQFNGDTGESLDQVEVKTIQGNNSTLAIKELTDIINDHLNKVYGVSNFILGDDSSAKYDNAELSDYQFIKRRVYPALMGFWDQFQFELDRIVDGLGYAIQFELELPDLTERQRVRAEIAKMRAETLVGLIKAGSSAVEAVKALDLSDNWLGAARGIYARALVEPTIDKQKDIQNNNSQLIDNKTTHSCQCTHTSAYTGCSTNVQDALPPMTADEKRIYDILVAMAERIFTNTPNIDEEGVIRELLTILEENAKNGALAGGDKLVELVKNEDVVTEIKNELKTIDLSGTLRERLESRTSQLVNNYGENTRRIMEDVLASSEGKSAAEIRKALQEVMPTWQAERIARTETVYAFKSGRLDEDKRIADRHGLNVKLVWRARHDADTCPVCAAMDGEVTDLGQAFVDAKETEDGEVRWEHSFWNDSGQVPNAHPNCVLGETIVEADNVKLATKMNYSGDIVKLKTASGKTLRITPNHILLTDRGWISANNIKKSDKVITYGSAVENAMVDNTIHGGKTTIADKFISLEKSFGVASVEMPVSAEDFKGDAVPDEKVQIILPQGFLRNKRNATPCKLDRYLPFVGGEFINGPLFGFSSLDQILTGTLLATNGVMGGESNSLALLGSSSSHPSIHSITSTSAYNTRLDEAKANCSSANIKALRNSFLANSGLIKFDNIVGVEIESVHNTPVYDLETTSTLYTANGIVSSNCRCYFDEIVEEA